MLVNHEDDKVLIWGALIECKRGQSLMSLPSWAEHFRWSIQQVRTFFKLLESDNMITIEGMRKTTRLTICNYDIYQDKPTDRQQTYISEFSKNKEVSCITNNYIESDNDVKSTRLSDSVTGIYPMSATDKQQTDNRQITDSQQTDNRQITSNKKEKNYKKEKKEKNIEQISFSFVSPEFIPAWEKWLSYRSEIKKSYKTVTGMKTKYNELVTISGGDPAKALLIIDQSIGNEWTGFFPLKTNNSVKNVVTDEDPVDRMIRESKELLKQKQTA